MCIKNTVVYIHGKGGSADEALYYKKFLNDDYEVLGFDSCGEFHTPALCVGVVDYNSELPWQNDEEFQNYFDSVIQNYNQILLIANKQYRGLLFYAVLIGKTNRKSTVCFPHCR